MGYPIQEQPQRNNFKIWVEQSVAGVLTMVDWTSYVMDVHISVGDTNPTNKKVAITPGSCDITFKAPPSNGSTISVGQGIIVTSAALAGYTYSPTWFAGIIQDIDLTREISPKDNSLTWIAKVSAGDLAEVACQTGEVSLDNFYLSGLTNIPTGEYWTVNTSYLNDWSFSEMPVSNTFRGNATNVNFIRGTMDYATFMQSLADSTQCRLTYQYFPWMGGSGTVPSKFSTWARYLTWDLYANATSPSYTATDGTHTSGTPTLKPLDFDYGTSTRTMANKCTLNNTGLTKGMSVALSFGTAENLTYTYSVTQSVNSRREITLDTNLYADNQGWNYIGNTLTGQTRLATASTSYFTYQNSSGRSRNNHGSCRVLVNTTYTAGQSVVLLDVNDFPDMLTSPAGGTTGNWYFRFYAQSHASSPTWTLTPGIRWYDITGTLLSTTAGSATNVTSTTAWTAVTVNGAKPANAVTGVPFFNVNSVNAVGNSFYITDAYFGQQAAYLTYDGDTPDDSTYVYSWTGQRWNSPTQRNSATPLVTLANAYLTRNNVTNVATRARFNFDQNPTDLHNVWSDGRLKMWINGTAVNYLLAGYTLDISPNEAIVEFSLINY